MTGKYILMALLVAVLVAAGWYLYGGHQAPPGQPRLESLTTANAPAVKDAFNAGANDVRVLLLLSPT
jgi:hypothetical protein